MERIIKVKDICGKHCVGIEDGEKLFDNICSVFKVGEVVLLDFVDVLTITSSFLNAAIGKLFGLFNDRDIAEKIQYRNLDENDTQLIQLVSRNAKEHFEKIKNGKTAENKIVDHIIEENNNG